LGKGFVIDNNNFHISFFPLFIYFNIIIYGLNRSTRIICVPHRKSNSRPKIDQ